MDILKQIQVYGDSILKGVLLDKSNGKYVLPKFSLTAAVEQMLPIKIKNNSKFGCTIAKGSKQLEAALEKGMDCDFILLEYGGNDCDFNWKQISDHPEAEHQPNTPLSRFEQIYRQMIDKIISHGIKALVASLPPIDAEKYFNWITRGGLSKQNILNWLGDVQHIYRFQELYSNTVCKIAYETGCTLIDIRSAFLHKRNFKELLCEDGIHPTAEGQQLIRSTFVDYGYAML